MHVKPPVSLHSSSNSRILKLSFSQLARFSLRTLFYQHCNESRSSEHPPAMDPIQQYSVGNPGSPSTVISPNPPPRRGKVLVSSSRATPVKKAAPAKISPAMQRVSASPVTPAKGSPKRKAGDAHGPGEGSPTPKSSKASPTKRARPAPVIIKYHGSESRARSWRDSPPDSHLDRVDRINASRMFIVGQQIRETDEVPEFYFDIVGSTGNIYKVKIGKLPSCDCPDALFRARGECKHIIYVLLKALNARPELRYQISFVPSELREMYEGSLMSMFEGNSTEDHDHDGKRKPLEGACPICFMDFEAKDKTVWCQTGCGNNVHEVCFKKWASVSLSSQGSIRCVYCRTNWPTPGSNPNVENLRKNGTIGREGYVNVAEQFGLSPKRVSSVYSSSSTAQRSRSSGQPHDDVEPPSN
ncbi:hypothetical protein PMG11_10500 [Penicillium brasilianum]|uniref:Uncharacterized protein n=1 Tax=Penicillium brasilianum TaxID=104259 RepID=A0A0F7TZ65_PENBI|nr:hypothetical protein PMG11_10500 [Penicillium brasilianum]